MEGSWVIFTVNHCKHKSGLLGLRRNCYRSGNDVLFKQSLFCPLNMLMLNVFYMLILALEYNLQIRFLQGFVKVGNENISANTCSSS